MLGAPLPTSEDPVRPPLTAAWLPLSALLCLLPLAACGKEAAPGGTGGGTGDDTEDPVVLPGEPDDSWQDDLPEGLEDPPENSHGGLDLEFDGELRDPVTAYADCGAWMSGCLSETTGDFEDCMQRVPICQTQEPWEEGDCCPADCRTAWRERTAAGASAADAYIEVFALDRSCFVGLEGGAR